MRKSIFISVITPCLNRHQFIAEAVESVMRQDYRNVEHIIVDGGSTDGTLEVLNRYPHLRVISEPDRNLYDAINKGIRLAKGEIIGHLNSDDMYAENVFGETVRLFQKHPGVDAVCGGACVFENDAGKKKIEEAYNEEEYKAISFQSVLSAAPIPNAKFFRRSVYERVGLYNTSYFIAADREFLLRLALKGVKTIGCDKILYYYRKHGESLTFGPSSLQPVFRTLEEYLLISEAFLRDHGSIKEIQYYCRKWHTFNSVTLFLSLIRVGRYREALSCALRGLRYDYRWLTSIGSKLFRYIFVRLPKKL